MIITGRPSFCQFHSDPLPIDVSKVRQAEGRKLYSSQTDIFVSFREYLVAKELKEAEDEPDDDAGIFRTYIKILRSSSHPITCVGLANRSYLLCTCNDEAVHVWKQDALLREWDKRKVVKSLGKILHCAMYASDREIYICLSKFEEILIIRCVSHVEIKATGSLDFAEIEIYSSIEKIKEPNILVGCFAMSEKLHVVGLAQGTGLSMRLWDVSKHNKEGITGKLLDHKTVSGIKSIAAADFTLDQLDVYMLLLGHDGQMEVYLLTSSGFWLINRLKMDDSFEERIINTHPACPLPSQSHSSNGGAMKAEFRILNGRFIKVKTSSWSDYPTESASKGSDSGNDSDENEARTGGEVSGGSEPPLLPSPQPPSNCDNRFDINLCPKLLALVASTRKILIVNMRSGEVELSIKYEDLDKDIGLVVNAITITYDPVKSQLVGAMQLMMDKNLYMFKLGLGLAEKEASSGLSSTGSICFLLSSEGFNTRSVLRKKLKSPKKNHIAKATKSVTASSSSLPSNKRSITTIFPPKTISSTGSMSSANSGTLKTSFTHVDLIRQGKMRWAASVEVIGDSSRVVPSTPRGHASPSTMSPRSLKINPHASYMACTHLSFDSDQCFQSPTRLADSGISGIRIGSSHDGKLIAVGANVSPLIILRTQPSLENARIYKDLGRVSSLHFAFNTKHLLVASNDCKTTLMDWQNNKELLHLNFQSKFNELIGSQFYFMDKFILQPEENKLVLYSYAVRETGTVALMAGSFTLQCQNITAIAAPNQFYSNFILCGLSSKCLQIFDANAERVAVRISQAHSRPLSCIRLNEAPKSGTGTSSLCNYILTSAPSHLDPIKLWDLRVSKCVTRIGDVNVSAFVPTARPAMSPCGRYIASGFEDNKIVIYDVRKINSRVHVLQGIRSTVLDCTFDPNFPMLWCAGRNGTFWNFYAT